MNNYHKDVVGYLIFKKVSIQNTNAISSPITYGFPAITGFLGSFHAISRKMTTHENLNPYSLGGVLLACHDCQPQTYRTKPYTNYTFNQHRNPIKKDGKTASIIEEGRCHLTMTFIVEVLGEAELSVDEKNVLIEKSYQWIQQHRIASGSVVNLAKKEPVDFIETESIDDAIPSLMPAFVLMNAQQEFEDIIKEVQAENTTATELDTLIDICCLHHTPEVQKNGKIKWDAKSKKTGRGWLVPMPVGYQGISTVYAAEEMQNIRNPQSPSQYVETIYSLGKWIYPQRLYENLESAFWRYHYNAKKNLYLVTQDRELDY